jgi:hypothetical protein
MALAMLLDNSKLETRRSVPVSGTASHLWRKRVAWFERLVNSHSAVPETGTLRRGNLSLLLAVLMAER